MNFPEKIKFIFIDQKTHKPIYSLATMLTLFAKEKNDYHIGPKITNATGEVVFTRDEIESEIKKSQDLFIMDYKSNLKDCSQLIKIETLSVEGIEKFIQARQEWGDIVKELRLTNEEIKIYKQSSNKRYLPSSKKFDVMSKEIKSSNRIMLIPTRGKSPLRTSTKREVARSRQREVAARSRQFT